VTARGGATDPAGAKLLPLEVNERARDLSPLDGSARRPALPTLRGLPPSFNIYLSAAGLAYLVVHITFDSFNHLGTAFSHCHISTC